MDTEYFNLLETHYWFPDDSHSMDAIVENKACHELLGIIKEVANRLQVELIIETIPVAEGGLKKWLKILLKDENKKATLSSATILMLISVLLINPAGKIVEKLIDIVFRDTELNELQKEKLRKEIEAIDIDNSIKLEENPTIRRRRSNFYQVLEKYPKIEKVSFDVQNTQSSMLESGFVISREDFSKFILTTDELEPITIEEAVIEIISPVLKKGKYKWSGYYNGEPIFFNMKSDEFKKLVQDSKVEFKNGSSINCALHINKKLTSEDEIKVSSYEVSRVNYYYQNDKPIETSEGKRNKRMKRLQESQPNLFSQIEDNQID